MQPYLPAGRPLLPAAPTGRDPVAEGSLLVPEGSPPAPERRPPMPESSPPVPEGSPPVPLSGPQRGSFPRRPPPAPRPAVGSPPRPLSPQRLHPAPEPPWVPPAPRDTAPAPQEEGAAKGPPSQPYARQGRSTENSSSTPRSRQTKLARGRPPPPHEPPPSLPALTRPNFPKPSQKNPPPPRPVKGKRPGGGTGRPPRLRARRRADRSGSRPVPLTFPRLRLIPSLAGCNFQSFPQLPSSTRAPGEGAERGGKVAATAAAAGIRWP
ncbi:proline-rich protein HaeIII subfamily 1-like [Chroicocephalus ridibundus]|uniref:proline-rich protein HaeIII subfamily 1-like n=1 Tax=Chroicocephalus ridibundus TaxID=1192867 RepID=UPI002FDD9AC4